jgi:glycerol-3-phosphate dehydrogenase
MKIAVVGGGINGVMSAWVLAARGCSVELYERDALMGATSSASTKLLHGGLRYLEHGDLLLVREALHERQWWLRSAPDLVHPLEFVLPIYEGGFRPAWKLRCGLAIYDWLAGSTSLGQWEWRSRGDVLKWCPELRSEGLTGAFTFYDAQMDDLALGLWAAKQARTAGVRVRTGVAVEAVTPTGELKLDGTWRKFDRVINAAGPWALQLLEISGVSARHDLDLVRGSHIFLKASTKRAFLLEVPGTERICFVLPYQGKTLVGTTEIRQSISEPVRCSPEECSYLLAVYNYYFPAQTEADVAGRFAGVRPLIRSRADATKASREYATEVSGKLITLFGGKWTTARRLGMRVAEAAIAQAEPRKGLLSNL